MQLSTKKGSPAELVHDTKRCSEIAKVVLLAPEEKEVLLQTLKEHFEMCKRAGDVAGALVALDGFLEYYRPYREERMAGNEELDEVFGPFEDSLLFYVMQQSEL